MKSHFQIGDRVIHTDGSIGQVEAIDITPHLLLVDVRWLTPNDEPSCCVSLCHGESLKKIPDHVLPMPRSKEWWAEASRFYFAVKNALQEMDL